MAAAILPPHQRPVLQACYREGGQILGLVDDAGHAVDGVRLLWALAGIESDYGCLAEYARHEPAYMPGGRYYQRAFDQRVAWQRWGVLAACSFGPFQILHPTARELGFDLAPWELANSFTCAEWARRLIVRRFIEAHGVKTLTAIFDSYNSGNARDANVPADYIAKGLKAYAQPLPAL